MLDNIGSGSGTNEFHNGRLERHDDDLKNEEGEADKAEAEDLSTIEGDHETFVLALTAEIGYSHVGVGCNLHADKARQHRGEGANQEGDHCVGALDVVPGLIHSDEDDNCEDTDEYAEVQVFFF